MSDGYDLDPAALAASSELAANLRRKGMTDALIQALLQICGREPADWVDTLQITTGLLFAGKLTGSGTGFNLDIYVAELRRKVARYRGKPQSPIVVTSQMPRVHQ